MSKLSLSIALKAYDDAKTSNAPSRSPINWCRDLNSLIVNNPKSEDYTIDPGTTQILFNSARTLLQDTTTQYSIALTPSTTTTYTLSWTGGTAPNFRTPRTTGADATTQVNVTLNGQTVTFTSSPGTHASFTGLIPGMILPITVTANNVGTNGNSAVLAGNGTSSINTLITAWNTANPSNQITLTSGNGTQVPDAGTYAAFTGTVPGMTTPVTITANTLGSVGNLVVLTGNGTSSINALISAWNTANASNQVTLTSGDGTQIPMGGASATYSGTPPGTSTNVVINALTAGTIGNSIVLTGDGSSSIDTLIANWNINNQANQVVLASGNGAQIPTALSSLSFINGINPSLINLNGGLDADIILSGGSSATPLNLVSGGVIVGDYVTIGSNFNLNNQGTYQVLAVTPTSFTIANAGGVAEGPILLGSSFATQIQAYSAIGVQVNDTLVISSGFSPASWGSYTVTAVYAESLQFSSTGVLPQQGPITTEIQIYSMAKQLIYMEADGNLSISLNGSAAPISLQPFVVDNCCVGVTSSQLGNPTPGMLLLKSTIFSVSVTNNTSNPINLFFAAVE